MPPTRIKETRVSEIDWRSWTPVDHATLMFVLRDGQILLIRKKRGLGAGKINGPGGRLDPGESPRQAAVREVEEEICVTPTGIRPHGELSFQFVDGYSIHVYVFSAGGFEGELRETEEAIPLWFDVDRIPYPEMWSDDPIWLPLLLRGKAFAGRFVFDGDDMLDHELEVLDDPAPLLAKTKEIRP
jgi:8-oxo-dGTP diphosphatase